MCCHHRFPARAILLAASCLLLPAGGKQCEKKWPLLPPALLPLLNSFAFLFKGGGVPRCPCSKS